MDFTKFVSLLATDSLYFCRADLFSDPFEGSYPKKTIKNRFIEADFQDIAFHEDSENLTAFAEALEAAQPDRLTKVRQKERETSDFNRQIRSWIYVSCWHANEYESEAMWKLYSTNSNEAVAIQTDYNTLEEQLPKEAKLGVVQYIDYEKEWFPDGDALYPFMHKRKSFEHEKGSSSDNC